MLLLALLVALGLVAFFAGAETAFATADPLRAELRAQRAGWAGRQALPFLHAPAALRATCLAGRTAALAAFVTLGVAALLRMGAGPGLFAALALGGFALLALGEGLPRVLLQAPPERALLVLAPPLALARVFFLPFTASARIVGAALTRLSGARPAPALPPVRRGFEEVLRESGGLDEDETELLENMLELRTLLVRDSMVRRSDIRAVPEGADLADVRQAFVESGHSRLPIYRGSLDTVVGVVLAHDLFHDPTSLAAVTRPLPAVPATRPARDFLFELLRTSTPMAVVVDDLGGTTGLVTVEDLLEELFGDIRDEHDIVGAHLRTLDEKTCIAAGRALLADLQEAFALSLPEGDYETVADYLLDRVGSVPQPRQSFTFDGVRFTILEASANRVVAVRIQKG